MRDIVWKSTKPSNLVVNACAGTFSVTKAWKLLHTHRTFIGGEAEPSCVNEAMLQLILFFARQVLSRNSDVDGEDVYRSAKL